MTAAEEAKRLYRLRCADIRATFDQGSRAYADAMSAASMSYEDDMVHALGKDEAAKLGAGLPRLGGSGTPGVP